MNSLTGFPRLQAERHTWESLLRPPSTPNPLIATPSPNAASIQPAILSSPSQVAILSTILPCDSRDQPPESLDTTTSTRLARATQTLDFDIDKFADNVHILGSCIDGANRMADHVLAMSADALEERERKGLARSGGDVVGVRDVLRGLSRVMER